MLDDLTYYNCKVTLDDTMLPSEPFKDHAEDITTVLHCLWGFNLKQPPRPYTAFRTDQVAYLGHICMYGCMYIYIFVLETTPSRQCIWR